MYPISSKVFDKRTFSTKFDQLTLVENRLFLKYQNKPEVEIPFAKHNKLYIKRYSLHPVIQFLAIAASFVFITSTIEYLDVLVATILSIGIAGLMIKSVMCFKTYRFYIILKDGTVFSKRVRLNKKSKNISVLEKVYAKYLRNNLNTVAAL